MDKFVIGINNPNEMSGFTLICEVGGVAGADDQWIKDLADHIRDNLPAVLADWGAGTVVNEITTVDDSRPITPNE